jgi:hypothetical protein
MNKKIIPTHDPYTGELNPYYEELTGEVNPLSINNNITDQITEKRSKHYGDVMNWIRKVIRSCETMDQLYVAKNLLMTFNKMYPAASPTISQSLRMEWLLKKDMLWSGRY